MSSYARREVASACPETHHESAAEPTVGLETLRQFRALELKLFDKVEKPVELGRLHLVRMLGAGAMGTVYAAYDPALDREVAVKLLRKGLLSQPDSRERMLREAKVLARLNHPNILTIHDLGFADGQAFITTELATGGTLAAWCLERPQPSKARAQQVLAFALQAAEGLAAAHDAGLIHRDVKPSNLLLGEQEALGPRLRVADFGLARADTDEVQDSMTGPAARVSGSGSVTPLTDAGSAVGTPAYMAPEQFHGRASARSDQFGWAVSFHEALYGVRPFRASTRGAMLAAIEAGEMVEAPRGAQVPKWVRKILVRCLAADPDDRFPTMRAVIDAIARARGRQRRFAQALGVVGVGVLVGLPGLALQGSEDPCGLAGNGIDAVWNDAARDRVVQGLGAAGNAFAQMTAERSAAMLDAYATDWRDSRVLACEATHVRHEQSESRLDDRVRCLDARLDHLDAIVDVLAEADFEVTQRAIQAVTGLPPIEPCADPQLVSATVEPPPDAIAAAVAEEEARLARVASLAAAGRYEDGLALATEVAERARALEYEPLIGRATVALGRRQLGMGQFEAARDSLRSGLMTAQRVGDDWAVSEAASRLGATLGLRLDRADEGLTWIELARATVPRLGPSSQWRLAGILTTEGSIRSDQGDARAALALLEQARALALEHGRTLTAANVLGEMAITQNELGDYEGAATTARLAMEEREALLGPGHPQVAKDAHNLGAILTRLRRPEEARPFLLKGLEKRIETFGADHVDVASSLVALGLLDGVEGKHESALERLGRAREIFERELEPDHPRIAMTLDAMARVYRRHRRSRGSAATARALARHPEAPRPRAREHLQRTRIGRLDPVCAGTDGRGARAPRDRPRRARTGAGRGPRLARLWADDARAHRVQAGRSRARAGTAATGRRDSRAEQGRAGPARRDRGSDRRVPAGVGDRRGPRARGGRVGAAPAGHGRGQYHASRGRSLARRACGLAASAGQ